ncbi:MAG: sodium:proton antiporter NhaD [Planctomycetes bacterium]|nr:sodium:proton antiporter NhaD [Planctomycetota bacterium]
MIGLDPSTVTATVTAGELQRLDFTASGLGLAALAIFVFAYLLVVLEERLHLRKSKPVVIAAGVLWILVAIAYAGHPDAASMPHNHLEQRVLHYAGEYGALFLFLMVAMTYISTIAAHNVFLWLNGWLVSRGFSLRAVYWATGTLAFCISPVADNLTTALLMGAVAIAVGHGNVKFLAAACTNIVIAANAGGAFSPFGDITTLMVWQAGKVHTMEFFKLLVPSLVNWLVPAVIMHFTVPQGRPAARQQSVPLEPGWWVVIVLFLATIVTAVTFHAALHLPPFLGMTTGLGYFFLYGWFRHLQHKRNLTDRPFDAFKAVAEVEWDTMLFFFGVILCVGALQELMFLHKANAWLYDPVAGLGATWANIGIGLLSALIDNVPVMFAVLGMSPTMDPLAPGLLHTPMADYQWLLVTLTAGVGGSLLSVGSAAGVALMGSAHGIYTFGRHLRFLPAIALGYAASIATHWWMNAP